MKSHFLVTYKISENTFCINVVIAASRECVERHYSGYKLNIREANEWELELARQQGISFIEV